MANVTVDEINSATGAVVPMRAIDLGDGSWARAVSLIYGANALNPGKQQLANALPIGSNSTSSVLTGLAFYKDLVLQLSVTAVPAGGAPTLDIYAQHSVDGGTTWRDIAHTQFTTAAATRFAAISGEVTGGTAIIAASDAALAGETIVQGAWGDQFRLKWVFAQGGSAGNYTLNANVVFK
jgi:hypothetical protein